MLGPGCMMLEVALDQQLSVSSTGDRADTEVIVRLFVTFYVISHHGCDCSFLNLCHRS